MKSCFALIAVLAVGGLFPAIYAQAADPPSSATQTNAPRLSVELTDGSHVLASPISSNFTWTTSFGPLSLQWHLLQSVERVVGTTNFTLHFRNGDHTDATPGNRCPRSAGR